VAVLKHLGQGTLTDSAFRSLLETARALREKGTEIQLLESISAPSGTLFPIVDTQDLYVREDYKKLYLDITSTFTDTISPLQNRIVITGTSGIGKSAFLAYFTVRLLSESDGDNPPIIVFHTKRSSRCYVYGGISTVCIGVVSDFQAFLDLPGTWYLVDSSPDPVLGPAKTILSASPKTLVEQYKEVAKESPRYYYMAPWELNELEECRVSVKSFNMVKPDFMEKLYVKMEGVPRYVLQFPWVILGRDKNATVEAEDEAYCGVDEAIKRVKDPAMLLECFAHGRVSLEFSSRILHQWPTEDNKSYWLAWASPHIQQEIVEQLKEKSRGGHKLE
ncbi:hypothetical protein BGZ54_007439, partial [Gamsiella multidivaricata]